MFATRTAVLAALLVQASLQPVQANDAMHHWLHACEKPQLEYWQELCRRSQDAHPSPPRTPPAAGAPPPEQKTTEAQAPRRSEAGKN